MNLFEDFALVASPLVSHSSSRLNALAGAVAHRELPFPAFVVKLRYIWKTLAPLWNTFYGAQCMSKSRWPKNTGLICAFCNTSIVTCSLILSDCLSKHSCISCSCGVLCGIPTVWLCFVFSVLTISPGLTLCLEKKYCKCQYSVCFSASDPGPCSLIQTGNERISQKDGALQLYTLQTTLKIVIQSCRQVFVI